MITEKDIKKLSETFVTKVDAKKFAKADVVDRLIDSVLERRIASYTDKMRSLANELSEIKQGMKKPQKKSKKVVV